MSIAPQRILVVDDDPVIYAAVRAQVRDQGVQVIRADSGESGLDAIGKQAVDLVLLDINLPGIDGFEVCRRLKNDPHTASIPIIFLTIFDAIESLTRGFELGASDYITKPFNAVELRARVRAALRLRSAHAALEQAALTDRLTGLPNRAAFHATLQRCLQDARQRGDADFAVLYLDLDRFKIVNDSLGHAVGDELLIDIAKRLLLAVRTTDDEEDAPVCGTDPIPGRGNDLVARMSGDEFTILLQGLHTRQGVLDVVQRILTAVDRPLVLRGHRVSTAVSIGVRLGEPDDDADELLRDADTAMYRAKRLGRNRYVVFEPALGAEARLRLTLENDLRNALTQNQFVLHYQPSYALHTGRITGFEALLTWNHPQRGPLAPPAFLAIAQQSDLIGDIGRWVLDQACAAHLQLLQVQHQLGPADAPVAMAVNVSESELRDPHFLAHIANRVATQQIRTGLFSFDVSERFFIRQSDDILAALEQFRNLGLRIAMDEFGVHFSSLASLHRFPIDVLKIDHLFVQQMRERREYAAIVQAIITLSHNLNVQVLAEGIESAEQLTQLQALECDIGQGFFLARPLTLEQALQLIAGPSQAFRLSA
jgi:predicted signal transduction protein with EAL and GGDEF domain